MEKFPAFKDLFDRLLEEDEVDLLEKNDMAQIETYDKYLGHTATVDYYPSFIANPKPSPVELANLNYPIISKCFTSEEEIKYKINCLLASFPSPLFFKEPQPVPDSECPCGGNHERVDMIFSAFCKKCDRTLT